MSVAAAQQVAPVSFEEGVFTVNQAWALEMNRLLHAAALRAALIPGLADTDITGNMAAVPPSEHEGAVLGRSLPRVHRSIQIYVAASVVDDVVNDTMLPLQARLMDERGELSVAKRLRRSDPMMRDIGDAALERMAQVIPRLGPADVPELTLPFAAQTSQHDVERPEQRTSRLVSVAPSCADGYCKQVQAPLAGARWDKDEFVQELTFTDEGGQQFHSNKMATSWVREHARESMLQRFMVPLEEGADPVWRVFEDLDNNVRSKLVHDMATVTRRLVSNWMPINSNGAPNNLPAHSVVAHDSKGAPLSTASLAAKHPPKLVVPLEPLFLDGENAEAAGHLCYESHASSLADSLLRAPSGELHSLRAQLRALDAE